MIFVAGVYLILLENGWSPACCIDLGLLIAAQQAKIPCLTEGIGIGR